MRRQHQEKRADRRRGEPSPRGLQREDTWGDRASTQGERPSSSKLWRGENRGVTGEPGAPASSLLWRAEEMRWGGGES